MHAANDQTPGCSLHLARNLLVALTRRMLLFQPARERMGRRGNDSIVVLASNLDDTAAQSGQIGTGIRNSLRNPGANFDLGS